jgi:hypothetical protein
MEMEDVDVINALSFRTGPRRTGNAEIEQEMPGG